MLNMKKLLTKVLEQVTLNKHSSFQHYGTATTSGTTWNLTTNATYLLVTGHNSTATLNGIWILRLGNNEKFNLCGGSTVTVTCSSNSKVTVKTSGGTVDVYLARLG